MPAEILEHCNNPTRRECLLISLLVATPRKDIRSDSGTSRAHRFANFYQRCGHCYMGTGLKDTRRLWRDERPRAVAEKISRILPCSKSRGRARDSLAPSRLVLAQPSITRKLVDNLTAFRPLRALLTNLFLVATILTRSIGPP